MTLTSQWFKMSTDLVTSTRDILQRRGTQQRIKGSNLIGQSDAPDGLDTEDNPTLREGDPVPVYAVQIPSDSLFAHGYGTDDRNTGRTAWTHAKFLADGSGTGTDGDVVNDAEIWLRVTDARRRRVKAETMLGDAEDYANAEADSRTEKPMQEVLEPAATEDRWIEVALVAGSGADGVTIDSDSLVQLYYTDINMG